jgi:hypothetical protein
MINIYIDNNIWDLLFDLGLDLCAELPRDEFRSLNTREGEMEIAPIPDRRAELRAFIEATIARCGVETDAHFGFREDSLPLGEQRTAGFVLGRGSKTGAKSAVSGKSLDWREAERPVGDPARSGPSP